MNVYCDKRKEVIMKLSEAVGKRVENLLAERNMTQYQLYKNGGIPRSTISVTVDGKYKTVKLHYEKKSICVDNHNSYAQFV